MRKDINRLKIVLAEQKKTNKMACTAAWERPGNCVEVVYQYSTTVIGNSF